MLSQEELSRYDRQLRLPEIGKDGQEKLKAAKVLTIGLGGLGGTAALYLTAAGVGTLGLVDKDTVSVHNLQRQILYREDQVGKSKCICAKESLQRLNRHCTFTAYDCYLSKENAEEIVSPYDLVLDCTDNFASRYLVDEACEKLSKPYVYASLGDFTGQLAVFNYGKNPANYSDLYPMNEQTLKQGNPAKGVLGVVPSVVASLQVDQAIKILCNFGTILKDTLLTIDLLNLQTTSFKIPPRKP